MNRSLKEWKTAICSEEETPMERLVGKILSLSGDIRYVAVCMHGGLVTSSRSGTTGASSSKSDKYEELIVNPRLLTLVTQRGNID